MKLIIFRRSSRPLYHGRHRQRVLVRGMKERVLIPANSIRNVSVTAGGRKANMGVLVDPVEAAPARGFTLVPVFTSISCARLTVHRLNSSDEDID